MRPLRHRSLRPCLLAALAAPAIGCDDGDSTADPMADVALDAALDAAVDGMPDPEPDATLDMAPAADLGPTPDMALEPDAGPEPPLTRFGAVDTCLTQVLETSAATGAAVAIVEDGVLVHVAGLGHKNDPDQTPVEPTTLFRFGSTLKGMTALAVFTEIEAGGVTPDTPVAEVLPALAEHADPRWQQLTVHHLLTHQGGLADYLALQAPGDPDSVLGEVVESEQFAASAYFMVDPGVFYNYSNPNFMLAGRVLEVLTGETYRDAMQALVFEPLGMQRVMFRPADVIADGDYALGVTAGQFPGTNRAVAAEEYDSVWGRPAGLGWASVADLARYAEYVIDGMPPADAMDPMPWVPPVDPETWATWRTGQVAAESFAVPTAYAHGLLVYDGVRLGPDAYHAVEVLEHGGNITGYTSSLLTVPELGIGASVLANGDGLNGLLEGCLASVVASSPLLPPPVEPPDLSPQPEGFAAYVGAYVGGPNIGPMIVTQTPEGELDVSLPAVDDANIPYTPRLQPIARDMFALSIQGFQVPLSGIHEVEGGPVKYLRTRFFVGERPEPGVEMPPMQKRPIDGAALRSQLERGRLLAEPAPVAARPWR